MKEQMKRTVYEAPETKLFRIEMESGFMQSSVGVETQIEMDDMTIEVEDYDRFDNEITFE